MAGLYIRLAFDVRDGTGNPHDAVDGSRGQLQRGDGPFQQGLIGWGEPAVRHGGGLIEPCIYGAGPRLLHFARPFHGGAHVDAGLARRRIGTQGRGRQARHFDMQVDSIQ